MAVKKSTKKSTKERNDRIGGNDYLMIFALAIVWPIALLVLLADESKTKRRKWRVALVGTALFMVLVVGFEYLV